MPRLRSPFILLYMTSQYKKLQNAIVYEKGVLYETIKNKGQRHFRCRYY